MDLRLVIGPEPAGRRQCHVRLFVAVWPPDDVIGLVAGLSRPDVPDLRWTVRPQWHVTLRFLGDVGQVDEVSRSLNELSGSGAEPVVLGPATSWFPGRRVLQVPVAGLDDLATRVNQAIGRVGQGQWASEEQSFRGHLTLARVRGRARINAAVAKQLEGQPISAEWVVRSVSLVESALRSDGAHYSEVTRVELGS